MPNPASLFRVLTELVFVLLGLLLAWVAATGRYLFNPRAWTWLGLGAFLIYWGVRGWMRTSRSASRAEERVRGASLALVGAMMLSLAWLPLAWVGAALGAAGGILIVRGLASAALAARSS